MTKLSKKDLTLKQEHANKLTETYEKLDAAVSTFNAAMEEAWEKVQEALDEHNTAIESANEWRGDIAQQMQDYYDNRSEKWQESDKGSEYEQWKSEWEESFDQVEMEKPDEPDFDAEDYAAIINDNLREEVAG